MVHVKKYFVRLNNWYEAQSFLIQLVILLSVLIAPNALRFVFQRNDWATYTDRQLGYTLEYPAHLWKRVSYTGFPGKRREVHLLLAWPTPIEMTHQISVGVVELENPTVMDVVTYYEDMLLEDGWQTASDLEQIEAHNLIGLTRTYYSRSGRQYQQVYFAKDQRGYLLRFTALPRFYESSMPDFEHVVASFQVFDTSVGK